MEKGVAFHRFPFAPAPPEVKEDYERLLEEALGFKRVLDEEGEVVDEELHPKLRTGDLLELYTLMVRARVIDSWLLRLQRMGKVALHAPNKGQEAAAVGVAKAMKPEDWLFPSYRELGAYIARGMSEEEILDRALNTKDDPLRGSDFAIYGNRKYNIVPAPVPVGNQIPHAVGAAMAAKILGDKVVSVTFFGDGATSRGDFHAGLNFAGVFKPPVVFVVQNNQYAISVPVTRQTAAPTLAVKALAYGVTGKRIDGNDILVVYSIAREAIERAREGRGPTLIEAVTYRMGPHTTADDPSRYRSDEEVKVFERLDPLRRFKLYLDKQGILTLREAEEIERDWDKRVEEIVRKVLEKPGLPRDVFFYNVYSRMPWHLEEEYREFEEQFRVAEELGIELEEE